MTASETGEQDKTTSEVITGNLATVITSEVVLVLASLARGHPPLTPPPEAAPTPSPFMDLHALHGEYSLLTVRQP